MRFTLEHKDVQRQAEHVINPTYLQDRVDALTYRIEKTEQDIVQKEVEFRQHKSYQEIESFLENNKAIWELEAKVNELARSLEDESQVLITESAYARAQAEELERRARGMLEDAEWCRAAIRDELSLAALAAEQKRLEANLSRRAGRIRREHASLKRQLEKLKERRESAVQQLNTMQKFAEA